LPRIGRNRSNLACFPCSSCHAPPRNGHLPQREMGRSSKGYRCRGVSGCLRGLPEEMGSPAGTDRAVAQGIGPGVAHVLRLFERDVEVPQHGEHARETEPRVSATDQNASVVQHRGGGHADVLLRAFFRRRNSEPRRIVRTDSVQREGIQFSGGDPQVDWLASTESRVRFARGHESDPGRARSGTPPGPGLGERTATEDSL